MCLFAALVVAQSQADGASQQQTVGNTRVRLDPAHPLKVGDEFYPAESVKLGEQGRCIVRVKVDKNGDIHDPQIATSSGYERLDAACLTAVTSGHMLPATKNGIAVDSTDDIPIDWRFAPPPPPPTLEECMAIPASLPLEKAQANLPPNPPKPKPGFSARVIVRLFVSEAGVIRAAKVDVSSGYAQVDQAAIKAATGQKMRAATQDKVPISACATMPIVWKLQ
jgi:TonB family protein